MIELDFYTLRPEIVQSIAKHGMSKAESKLFYYLLQLDPFGDRPIKLKVAEILLATGIGKTAYHAAVAKFEQLGWFDFKHTDVYISNLSCVRKSEKAVQKFGKTEKRFGKTDSRFGKTESRDTESAQGEEPFPPHTDLIPIHNDPDRSDEFFDFENANAENLEISEEEAIATLQANLDAEKCDLNPDQDGELTNTPEEATNPINGDSSRRKLEDFILKSMNFAPRDRQAYFAKFTATDWERWEAKFKPPVSPPVSQRDLVNEDPWCIENAIASMVKCKDFDAAKDRLSIVEKTNPILATQLREKYL
ncbi:MAG: hypothetical protein IM565_02255, partial [Pseudanabaena sp. M109S1SP2A07QC]|nr:hypothetical protein [Pseudanabaena sp. M109S1SP2A07QC]